MPGFDAVGARVAIRRPVAGDCDEFIHLMQISPEFHLPWLDPPKTPEAFADYLACRKDPFNDGFLVCGRDSGRIMGVININCIIGGFFQSAFLGYYAGAPYAGQGYMTEGMRLVTGYAFTQKKLHRLEANIQPGNAASIALVRKCGFRKEGYSPRYLQVLGQWCDHERWALLADDPTVSRESTS